MNLTIIVGFLLSLEPGIVDTVTGAKFPPVDGPDFEFVALEWATGKVLYIGNYSLTIAPSPSDPHFKGKSSLTLPITKNLLSGGVDPYARDSNAYRLTDLQRGDQVLISFQTTKKQMFINNIRILQKKDSSAIPASQNPHPKHPYHVWQNAENGWNYKGIAIPNQILKQYGKTEHPPKPKWMVEGKPAPYK